MKKIIYLASLMLVVTFSTTIFSCSSDDDESKEINYTTDEIVQILTGKWAIKGIYKMQYDKDYDIFGLFINQHEKIDTTYTGEIEFFDDMTYKCHTPIYGLNYLIGDYRYKYNVLRKNGDTYLSLSVNAGVNKLLDMKVLYLNKNKFKLVHEEPYYDYTQYYLTIESN